MYFIWTILTDFPNTVQAQGSSKYRIAQNFGGGKFWWIYLSQNFLRQIFKRDLVYNTRQTSCAGFAKFFSANCMSSN